MDIPFDFDLVDVSHSAICVFISFRHKFHVRFMIIETGMKPF